mgnify:CR=1 FL=1
MVDILDSITHKNAIEFHNNNSYIWYDLAENVEIIVKNNYMFYNGVVHWTILIKLINIGLDVIGQNLSYWKLIFYLSKINHLFVLIQILKANCSKTKLFYHLMDLFKALKILLLKLQPV